MGAVQEDLMEVSDDIAGSPVIYRSSTRTVSMYPLTRSRQDPELVLDDASTSWLMVMALLLLIPPLGWLQLSHRGDMDGRLRIAIAALASAIALAVWAGVLQLHPAP